MTLKARQYNTTKVKLQFEHEFIQVNRLTHSAPNDFGEQAVATTVVSQNTKAVIQPIEMLSAQQLKMFNQGQVEVASQWMMTEQAADIKPRDTVVDVDGKVYDVMEVNDWQSHKEMLLRIQEKNSV